MLLALPLDSIKAQGPRKERSFYVLRYSTLGNLLLRVGRGSSEAFERRC